MSALWASAEVAEATGGSAHGGFEARGVTFDSREVEPGDLFLALKGEASDGHPGQTGKEGRHQSKRQAVVAQESSHGRLPEQRPPGPGRQLIKASAHDLNSRQ